MFTQKMAARVFYPLLLAAALAGMLLAAYATTRGPGVGGDATIYLTSARSLLAGQGLGWTEADGSFRMLPYSPPFYPLALSGVGLLAADMVAGARWLNVLLFGLTIFLMGWFFYRYTGQPWLALFLSAALAVSPVILNVQVWAMTEPLFLLLGFAGLMLVLEYLARPRMGVLLAAAVLCGLAFLTRYIGVAFVAAGVLALLFLRPQIQPADAKPDRIRWAGRWGSALLYGAVAVLPMLVWLAIDYLSTGTIGSRSGQPASAYWQRFLEMGAPLVDIYLFWLLPDSVAASLPGVLRALLWIAPVAAVMALGWAVAWSLRRAAPERLTILDRAAGRMAALFGIFIVLYLIVLAVVQVFTYPPVTLASRMLSPVHFAALALVFTLLHLALRLFVSPSQTGRVVTAMVYLGCLALVGSYALRGALVAREYHRSGIGYFTSEWRDSPMLDVLRKMDPEIPIITNETTAVMFFLDRPSYTVQEIFQSQPVEEFTAFGEGDDEAQRVFREEGGALVLFHQTLVQDFAMYGNRLDERIQALTEGLVPYYQGKDGSIYFAPGQP